MSINVKHIIFFVMVFGILACNSKQPPANNLNEAQLLQKASQFASDSKHYSAINFLELALEKGLDNPMDLVRDNAFYPLIDNAEFRAKFRSLLKKYSNSHKAIMVRDEEPGEHIFVTGEVLDESNQQPIKGALVELVHTDTNGLYFSEKSMWNPRIFAYLRTNDKGNFIIETIYPGSYKDDDGLEVAPHIHFTIEADGYRAYASEFVFSDDPVFALNGNSENLPVAKMNVDKGEGNYHVTINLQSN